MGYIKDFNLSIYHSKYTQVHPVWLWMAKYHLTAQDGFPQKQGHEPLSCCHSNCQKSICKEVHGYGSHFLEELTFLWLQGDAMKA